MTSAERNLSVVRQLRDAFNEQDRDRLELCYAPTIVVHASDGAERSMDHEEHWDEIERMYTIYPDIRARIEHMIADERSVFLRGDYTGTHTGAVEGSRYEPTGRTATWAWWCEYRFDDGKIFEAWNIYDNLSQLQQLGLWSPEEPKGGA